MVSVCVCVCEQGAAERGFSHGSSCSMLLSRLQVVYNGMHASALSLPVGHVAQ
jgi:hypothetical protein